MGGIGAIPQKKEDATEGKNGKLASENKTCPLHSPLWVLDAVSLCVSLSRISFPLSLSHVYNSKNALTYIQ